MALDPGRLCIDDRTEVARFRFVQMLAKHVRFSRLDGGESDWTSFFGEPDDCRSAALRLDEPKAPPHEALFRTFLGLLEHARADLNQLSAKHLEFYYEKTLRLTRKTARPDSVHVLLEPVSRIPDPVRVRKDTKLNGGKEITYATEDELFVSQARIARLHSVFSDPAEPGRVRYAMQSDSADGFGEPLPTERPGWKAFGHADLPVMQSGWALASPVLALKEGTRTITATVELSPAVSLDLPADELVRAALQIELSGEDRWLGPFPADSATLVRVGGRLRLVLKVVIGPDEDPVTLYDPTLLEGGFATVSPVMKVMLGPDADSGLAVALDSASVESIRIAVHVEGAKELDLENDLGRLNADKPFMPFGPRPAIGSSLYVGSDEMLSKNISSFKLRILWQDAPPDLATHYNAYGRSPPENSDFTAQMSFDKRGSPPTPVQVELFASDATEQVVLASEGSVDPDRRIRYADFARFFARPLRVARILFPLSTPRRSRAISLIPGFVARRRFPHLRFGSPIRVPRRVRMNFATRRRRIGFIRLSLEKDFLHSDFPYLFSSAITSNTQRPKEPYTPVIESLELEYDATTDKVNPGEASLEAYEDRAIQLFQLTPFGHAEEHGFLKTDLSFLDDHRIYLLPQFPGRGALYVGIDRLGPREVLSLLVQVVEGTADPQEERPRLSWSLLIRNHWRPFEPEEILADETNSFLRSGIVRLQLPGDPMTENTLLDPGHAWLRVTVAQDPDAVCDLLALHTQAVKARPVRNESAGNGTASLEPNTIAKLITPIAAIRSVRQPYASFGGSPSESESHFRTRVSERLRHRMRAITAWDYERLVLERFPEIHRVRCLTHSNHGSSYAPGEIMLVVIPNIVSPSAFDRLTPRADLNTLSLIKDYVNALNPSHVTARAVNPDYEEIRLEFLVRFKQGKPFANYRGVLNEELVRFLSPWVRSSEAMPRFGGRLHRSAALGFIESRDYVEFVTDLRMVQSSAVAADVDVAAPSLPQGILVSTPLHSITEYDDGHAA